MNAKLEVTEDLLKHARKLSLSRDPERRIEASRWEIFFATELQRLRKIARGQSANIAAETNTVADDEIDQAVCFSLAEPKPEVKP